MARKRLLKVHSYFHSTRNTACGIKAFIAPNCMSEADTASGTRIEIATQGQKVTCERCIDSLVKASLNR